jgi:hypothetical protein
VWCAGREQAAADATCELPENGVRTPKYVGGILIFNFLLLTSAFVFILTNIS